MVLGLYSCFFSSSGSCYLFLKEVMRRFLKLPDEDFYSCFDILAKCYVIINVGSLLRPNFFNLLNTNNVVTGQTPPSPTATVTSEEYHFGVKFLFFISLI